MNSILDQSIADCEKRLLSCVECVACECAPRKSQPEPKSPHARNSFRGSGTIPRTAAVVEAGAPVSRDGTPRAAPTLVEFVTDGPRGETLAETADQLKPWRVEKWTALRGGLIEVV